MYGPFMYEIFLPPLETFPLTHLTEWHTPRYALVYGCRRSSPHSCRNEIQLWEVVEWWFISGEDEPFKKGWNEEKSSKIWEVEMRAHPNTQSNLPIADFVAKFYILQTVWDLK